MRVGDGRLDTLLITGWWESDYPNRAPVLHKLVVIIDESRAVSQTMNVVEGSRGLGLSDEALLVARRVVKRPLYSSSNAAAEWWLETEGLTDQATKVWARLLRRGAQAMSGTFGFVLP